MKVGDFMGALFLSRDVAHRVHLSTRSFARHSALDGFYRGIVDLADGFAEAYQGRHGLITSIPLMANKREGNIIEFLQAQLDDIEEGRYEVCEESDSALQNIIDEIVALFLSTIYKLKFLE
jgi:hypothetical protein